VGATHGKRRDKPLATPEGLNNELKIPV